MQEIIKRIKEMIQETTEAREARVDWADFDTGYKLAASASLSKLNEIKSMLEGDTNESGAD